MNDPWTEVLQPDVTNFVIPVTLTPNSANESSRPSVSSVTIAETLSTPQASHSVCSTIPAAGSTGPSAAHATSCSLVPESAPTRGAALGVALGIGAVLIGSVAAITYKWWRRRKNEQYSKLTPSCEKALQDPGAKQLLSLASPTYPPSPPTALAVPKRNKTSLPPIQERASTDGDHGADGIELLHQPSALSNHTPLAPALELQPFPGRLIMNLGDKPPLPAVQNVAKLAASQSTKSADSHYGSIHSTSTRGSSNHNSRTSSPFPSGGSPFKAYSPAASKQNSPQAESPVDPFLRTTLPTTTSHTRSISSSSSSELRSSTHTPIPLMRSKAPSVVLPQVPFKISPLAMHSTRPDSVIPPPLQSYSALLQPGKQFVPYSTLRRAPPLPLDYSNSTANSANSGTDFVNKPFPANGSGRRGAVSE